MFNCLIPSASIGRCRLRWLGSTMMAAALLVPWGEAEAEDQCAPTQPSIIHSLFS